MTVSRGLYRHYKGFVCYVSGVSISSSNLDSEADRERRWVIYETDRSITAGVLKRRPEYEFEEFVDPSTGQAFGSKPTFDGAIRRFTRIDSYKTTP